MSTQEVISISGLGMRFPGRDALRGVDLTVRSGTVFALLGENGADKTTLIRNTVAILHAGKFSLFGELVDLKDTISEVTVSIDDPLVSLPELAQPAEVLGEETVGRQRRMIVRGFNGEIRHALSTHLGVSAVKDRPASLEELFIACTRGIGAVSRPHDREPAQFENAQVSGGVTR